MIREVVTISRISANAEELNLSCGHSVPAYPEEVKKLATEAAINRTNLKVDCKQCDADLLGRPSLVREAAEQVFRAGFKAGALHGLDYGDMGLTVIDGETYEDRAWKEFKGHE